MSRGSHDDKRKLGVVLMVAVATADCVLLMEAVGMGEWQREWLACSLDEVLWWVLACLCFG